MSERLTSKLEDRTAQLLKLADGLEKFGNLGDTFCPKCEAARIIREYVGQMTLFGPQDSSVDEVTQEALRKMKGK